LVPTETARLIPPPNRIGRPGFRALQSFFLQSYA
jgi:hypothetical protein